MRTKGEECSKLAAERDLLAAQLAKQKELLKKAQDEAKKREAALLAEFESERSSWTDKEAQLTSGFHEIEDIIDVKFLSFLRASDYASGRLLIFDLLLFCPGRLLPWSLTGSPSGHRGCSRGAKGNR